LNENAEGVVPDPKAAGLAALLPKLKVEGEAVVFVLKEPKPELGVVGVVVLPKEKEEEGAALVVAVFPKLNEFEVPVLLAPPKLNCEGEFVGALKEPNVVVFEVLALGVPNPVEGVENDPKDVVPVEPKAEGVEVDDWPKEKADGVVGLGLAPKEKGEEVVAEGVPKAVGVVEPNEKAEDVVDGVVWPKAEGAPKAVGAVVVPTFL